MTSGLNLELLPLDSAGLGRLYAMLKGKSQDVIADNMVQQLTLAGAKNAIIEHAYIDKDFTEMYVNYYAGTFKRLIKLCTRIFIFKTDFPQDLLIATPPTELVGILEDVAAEDLMSVIVVRPVDEAPINSIVSKTSVNGLKVAPNILVKSKIETHLCGARLLIEGNHTTQQESRVGACAQAALWGVARYFNSKHNGPWAAIPEITELATSQADIALSTALPMGSEGLRPTNMVYALKALGQEPFTYTPDDYDKKSDKMVWNRVNPREVICRYLDSGIPLILGLRFQGQNDGHAVVATGRMKAVDKLKNPPPGATIAEFYSHYLVNDDQQGANLLMGIDSNTPVAPPGHDPGYNIEDNLNYILVPLPQKVFTTAEKAEKLVWGLISDFNANYPDLLKLGNIDASRSKGAYDIFTDAVTNKTTVVRTYLTYGWKYKQRALQNNLETPLKVIIRNLELPRYVWVTEIGTLDSLEKRHYQTRRIYGHMVVDATAKNTAEESVLLFHAPGFCMYHQHINGLGASALKRHEVLLENSQPYFPKRRGETTFHEFYEDLNSKP